MPSEWLCLYAATSGVRNVTSLQWSHFLGRRVLAGIVDAESMHVRLVITLPGYCNLALTWCDAHDCGFVDCRWLCFALVLHIVLQLLELIGILEKSCVPSIVV